MSVKARILFVDDEERVLDGLRRMLRSMRNEWEMSFFNRGQDALNAMQSQAYDVIISDMMMPGMNGAELLKAVREHHPRTVRIALSGQTNKELILHATESTHQFLSKPCDMETLKSTLLRACALRDILTAEKLQGMLTQLDTLPSLPSSYTNLIKELESPEVSIKSVEKIISADIGMSTKILRMVNSAFLGLRQHISSPAQAIVLLGLETIKSLVTSLNLFSTFDKKDLNVISIDSLWNHSFMVGTFSKKIANQEKADRKITDDAFITGLVHDVGKLVLASELPGDYQIAVERAKQAEKTNHDAEREVFGATHAQVGAYLMGLWGFGDSVIEGIAYHHEPRSSPTRGFTVLTAVHVANALAHESNPEKLENANPLINNDYLTEVSAADRIQRWREICYDLEKREVKDEQEYTIR